MRDINSIKLYHAFKVELTPKWIEHWHERRLKHVEYCLVYTRATDPWMKYSKQNMLHKCCGGTTRFTWVTLIWPNLLEKYPLVTNKQKCFQNWIFDNSSTSSFVLSSISSETVWPNQGMCVRLFIYIVSKTYMTVIISFLE